MSLRIAIFGQARFGLEVTERLAALGHEVVGVWAPPDGRRADPLAELAERRGWPLFRHRYFRRDGEAIPEYVDEYRAFEPQLNVLAFTTAILPPEMAFHPEHGSICFHPSLLPAYRGGAALSWQIIRGETHSGVSVFRLGYHVDRGPLLVQRDGVQISPRDTMASLYFEKLYPLGVEAMVEAVQIIDEDRVQLTPQGEEGASWFGLIDDEAARIDWSRSAREVDRLLRGCDPAPGALAMLDERRVRLFSGAEPRDGAAPPGTLIGLVDDQLEIATGEGSVCVKRVAFDDRARQAAAELGLAAGSRFT